MIISGLLVIIITHAFLITKLIFYPYPELFIYPYLTNQGLLPYKQIFDQHFPGLLFFPINLNNLGMTDEIVARFWLIGIVVISQLLLFIVAKNFFQSPRKALLVSFLYLLWQPFLEGWVLWIDSFLPIFLLPAFYFYNLFSKRQNSFWLFLTGLFLGVAIALKQVIIPLSVILFIFLLWQKVKWQGWLSYIIGLVLPVLGMLGYLRYLGVLKEFWFWNIVFNLTTYAKLGTKGLSLRGWIRLIGISFPIFFMLTSIKRNSQIVILLIFTIGALTSALDRPDLIHFQPALPFIVLGVVWGIGGVWKRRYGKVIVLVYTLLIVWWLGIFYKGHLKNQVLFFDSQTKQIAQRIKQYSNLKEEIFLFGVSPHLYQMTNTLPAGRIFVFQFPWFLKITEDRFLNALQNKPPILIVRDQTIKTDDQYLIDYAASLNSFITKHYQVFDKIGDVEFMRLR